MVNMRLITCLIVLMALGSAASAEPSRITTGPYDIIFDLGTTMNYTVEFMSPYEGNNYTSYTVLIDVPNITRAGIYILVVIFNGED